MKCNRTTLACISGLVWFAVGFFLLVLGLNFITKTFDEPAGYYPLAQVLHPLLGGAQEAGVLLIAVALYVGFLKGKYVLGKSARKGVQRLQQLQDPSLQKIYSAKYYLLLGGMVGLGMSIKYFGVPADIRGFVDIAIGAALIQGSLIYFRSFSSLKDPVQRAE